MNRNLGVASLLTVLAVLCMSIFAILTFTTAKADDKLSEVTASSVENYYNAEYEAQKILADIRNGNIPENVEKYNDEYVYTCNISENLVLKVRVEVKEGDYKIISWKEEENKL